jgi:bla regulator protein blaR1
MMPESVSAVANHLWQSTLFAGVVGLLTLAFRNNRAPVRYGLWLAASVKFLIPFWLLLSLGSQIGWRAAPAIAQPQVSFVMEEIGRPFSTPASAHLPAEAASASTRVPAILFGVWLCGFAIGVFSWVQRWRRIRAVVRAASPLRLDIPIQAMSTPARLEPGIFGIRKPVLLLPEGITDRLTPAQLDAIVAHELCHYRRRDNLAAAVHMAVEALFWFHPLVWWIETRLLEERECACDEEVLRAASDPEVYAEGILNVCKFYLESPLVCVSGVTGANLKKRIETIMTHRVAHKLTFVRKLLLAMIGIAAVTGPIAIGMVDAPQAQAHPAGRLEFEAASVKPNQSGREGWEFPPVSHGRLTIVNASLRMLIAEAYDVQRSSVTGPPGWFDSQRYDIVAKGDADATDSQVRLMLRTLLTDRFSLALHRETKELPILTLTVAKNGPKLKPAEAEDLVAAATNPVQPGKVLLPSSGVTMARTPQGGGAIFGSSVSMPELAGALSIVMERPVIDKTGLTGNFDLGALRWTGEGYKPSATPVVNPQNGEEQHQFDAPSIFTALQEQLGLRLESAKGPVEILVIDRAAKATGN